MQTTVLIEMFTTLLVRRKITREALSEKFELSTRTITRYIDVLSKAGIPIESRAGIGGGYSLPDDFKLDRMLFCPAEYGRIARALADTEHLYPDALNRTLLDKLGADPETLRQTAEAGKPVAAELEFTLAARDRIAAWLGEKSIKKSGGGIYRASAELPGMHNLVRKLLSFGADVRVLAPEALKKEILAECRNILTKNE